MNNDSSGFVAVDGGRLYYEVAGQGHPLVLIHAGIADSSMWDEQWETLAQRFRVIRYDARGFGQSQTESVPYSPAEDLLALLDHLGVEKAFIVGLSRGGAIAIDFTLAHPERVAALVPVAAGVGGYELPEPQTEQARQELELYEQMEALEESGEWERLADLDVQVWVDGPLQPAGRAAERVRERVREMTLANYLRDDGKPTIAHRAPPAIRRLHEVRVPTLIIVGDLDTSETLHMANLLAEQIPEAHHVVFHDVAHMVNLEQPELFSALVQDFLSQV